MALRRDEDLAACAVIGAEAIHLPFLEAPHRGYASAAELFAARRLDDSVVQPLTYALTELIGKLAPDRLLGPLAIGDHVDHWIVRESLAASGQALMLWEDWPYLRRADPTSVIPALRCRLTEADRRARLAMCAAYGSQLGYQFGGVAGLEEQIAGIEEERLYAA